MRSYFVFMVTENNLVCRLNICADDIEQIITLAFLRLQELKQDICKDDVVEIKIYLEKY